MSQAYKCDNCSKLMEPDERALAHRKALFQDNYEINIDGRHKVNSVDYHQCSDCFIESLAVGLLDCLDDIEAKQLILFLTSAPGEIDRNPNICIDKSA